jgi:hypothetical protein
MSDTPKRAGRPAKYSQPLTPAQRVKESRERAYIAMLQVTDDIPGATTKALLGNLARQIKLIDTDKDHAPVARDVAASVMLELCNRYKITLPLQ